LVTIRTSSRNNTNNNIKKGLLRANKIAEVGAL